MKKYMKESLIYFIIDAKQQRSIWIITLMFSMVIPMGILCMVALMPGEINRETAIIYISGNMISAISNLCIMTLAQLLIQTRQKNGFEHMATLPINRFSPLTGIFLSSAISTIPSLLLMPVVGMLLFDISLHVNLWLFVFVIISGIIMVSIGAVVGTFSDNYNLSYTLAEILMFVVMFATPVYYSIEELPAWFHILQRFLPFIYMLEGIRQILYDGTVNRMVYIDLLVLIIYMAVLLSFTFKFFSWKQRD